MTDTSQQLYVSRPQTVEAIQWTDDNWTAVSMFAGDAVDLNHSTRQLWLRAGKDGAQEWVPVPVGHWLVHQPGDRSDIWPIDPDYFAAKYQPEDLIDGPRIDQAVKCGTCDGTGEVVEDIVVCPDCEGTGQ